MRRFQQQTCGKLRTASTTSWLIARTQKRLTSTSSSKKSTKRKGSSDAIHESPKMCTVHTEGYGPSEDLIRGVQPHSHLVVEATGLHPRDFAVQKRVLELAMPSLSDVTVSAPTNDLIEREAARVAEEMQKETQSHAESSTSTFSGKEDAKEFMRAEVKEREDHQTKQASSPSVDQDIEDELSSAHRPPIRATAPIHSTNSEKAPLAVENHQVVNHEEAPTIQESGAQHDLSLKALEVQMVTIANLIIEQVEKRTSLQVETIQGSQDERHRSGTEVIVNTLREEVWRMGEALKDVSIQQGFSVQTALDSMTKRICDELQQQQHVREPTQSSFSGETVGDVSDKVKEYFANIEIKLKGVVSELQVAANKIATTSLDSGVEQHERSSLPAAFDESRMNQLHNSLVATIEQSSQQQLEHIGKLISDMMLNNSLSVDNPKVLTMEREEKATATNLKESEEAKTNPPPDFTALEEYIDGALRASADEIRRSVVGELNQFLRETPRSVPRSGENGEAHGLTSEQAEKLLRLSERMQEVVVESQQTSGVVSSVEDITGQIYKAQVQAQSDLESIKGLLENHQHQLLTLQREWKSSTPSISMESSDGKEAPLESASNSLDSAEVKKQLIALASQQEHLQSMLQESMNAIAATESSNELQLQHTVTAISEFISQTIKDINPVKAGSVKEEVPIIATSLESSDGAPISLPIAEALQKLEGGVKDILTQLKDYQLQVESLHARQDGEMAAPLRAIDSSLPALTPQELSTEIRQVVEGALQPQLENLLEQMKSSASISVSETAELVTSRNAETIEQKMLSLAGSLGEIVKNSIAELKEDSNAKHAQLRAILLEHTTANRTEEKEATKSNPNEGYQPISTPAIPLPMDSEINQKLANLEQNLLRVVQEEMGKTHDVDMSPIFKYIDSMLIFVREELMTHHAALKKESDEVAGLISAMKDDLPSKSLLMDVQSQVSAGFENQASQLREVLSASSQLVNELGKARQNLLERVEKPNAGELTPQLSSSLERLERSIDVLPEALDRQEKNLMEGWDNRLKEISEANKQSLEALRVELVKLPREETIQERLNAVAARMSAETMQSITTTLANQPLAPPAPLPPSSFASEEVVEALKPVLAGEREALSSEVLKKLNGRLTDLSDSLKSLAGAGEQQQRSLMEAVRLADTHTEVKSMLDDISASLSGAAKKADYARLEEQVANLEKMLSSVQKSHQADTQSLKDVISDSIAGLTPSAPNSSSSSETAVPPATLDAKMVSSVQRMTERVLDQQKELGNLVETVSDLKNEMKEISRPIRSTLSSAESLTAASKGQTESLQAHTKSLHEVRTATEKIEKQIESIASKVSASEEKQEKVVSTATRELGDQIMRRFGELQTETQKLSGELLNRDKQMDNLTETVKDSFRKQSAAEKIESGKHDQLMNLVTKLASKEGLASAVETIQSSTSTVLSGHLASLEKALGNLEEKLKKEVSAASVGTSNVKGELKKDIQQMTGDLSALKQTIAAGSDSHAKVREALDQLSQKLDSKISSVSTPSDPIVPKLDEMLTKLKSELLVAHQNAEKRLLKPLQTSLDQMQSNTLSSIRQDISEAAKAAKGSLESDIARMKSGLDTSFQNVSSSYDHHATRLHAKIEKEVEELTASLPRKVAAEVNEATERILERLWKELPQVSTSSASKAAEPMANPFTSSSSQVSKSKASPSLGHTLGLFLAQTLFICLAVLLCFYFFVAAVLIAFVPKPSPSPKNSTYAPPESHETVFNKRKVKRVADCVLY